MKEQKQDWYARRDARTKETIGVKPHLYETASVNVIIGEVDVGTFTSQIMAILSVNMLVRWCRKINIDVTDVPCVIDKYKGQSLKSVLREIVCAADPECILTFDKQTPDRSKVWFVIGHTKRYFERSYVWAKANGWVAGYGFGASPANQGDDRSNTNPIGAMYAACLGISEVFRRANAIIALEFSIWYSLYDFNRSIDPGTLQNPNFPAEVDLGIVHQIGCGAIGSSFDYLLALTDWKGQLHLIDYDKIEDQNTSSSLIFSKNDAEAGRKKTEACNNAFRHTNINALEFDGDFNDFVDKMQNTIHPADLVLCFANDRNIWSSIQNNYPPLVLHATTNKNWGINFGRHIPLKEECILCTFEDVVINEAAKNVSVCAAAELPNQQSDTKEPQKEVLTILPFLAPAIAVIVLAEMAKLHMGAYPVNDNFLDFSFRVNLGKFITYARPPKPCHVCIEQDLNIYPSSVIESKHWHLSLKD